MNVTNKEFLADVLSGLSAEPKTLSSKYFYDKKGDELFQQIMDLEEYYLTKAEYEIFKTYKSKILDIFTSGTKEFRLIEFGAGDGYKTKVLLEHFIESETTFEYKPIDISQNAIDKLKTDLNGNIPKLNITAEQGDYFQVLKRLPKINHKKNVILFLGSNIGNFTLPEVESFLIAIRNKIFKNDLLFLGLDLKKNPDKILRAYNDSDGVTRDFNLNLLSRINRELNANFDIDTFEHYAAYNPVNGECISTLISTKQQEVTVDNQKFFFEQWEPIHTEISRKFSLKQIEKLAAKCGFTIEKNLIDKNEYFVDSIWKAV
ncbi:L-histidine N(alpha)-methyltransferase [Reichenbachiella sp. MALMAid0571]|uniref:L-histidine N(alpha)-methyltransferase n=1 Tax=Reichenbachiella sp. MALMAid0571 TaxID=3143939 RepID=UPI0032DED14A